MSRKILKIGTDVLTLNDKLVSVKEDYPFWRVNSDNITEYYNALLFDKREINNSSPEFYTSLGFNGTASSNAGAVLGPDGISIYTVPLNNSFSYRFNTVTKVFTPIFNISGNDKFYSAHVVGKYIIFTPFSHTSIIRHDTETGVNTSIGSFAGTGKWGKGTLAPNGKIYCPPIGSAQWLVIDVNDPENITTQLVTNLAGANNASQYCSAYSNGFIYSFTRGASNNRNMLKFNINTNVITSSTFLGLNDHYTCVNINGLIYVQQTYLGSRLYIVNTNNSDSITTVNQTTEFSAIGSGLGADNEIYLLSNSGVPAIKYNLLSGAYTDINKPPVVAPATAESFRSCGVITNKFGESYSIPAGGSAVHTHYFWRINSATTEELNLNRILNRHINRT